MTEESFTLVCHGSLTTLAAVAALCLLRFWVETKDRLFALFAAAFALMAVHWGVLTAVAPAAQSRHWIYLLRLAALSMIAAAIIDKNRTTAR